jgi:hypothetical protein
MKTLVEAWEHFIEGGYPDPIKNDPSMQVILKWVSVSDLTQGKRD